MSKTKSFLFTILLAVALSVNGFAETTAKSSISGQIKNLPEGMMQLILEEDINRKKSRVIAEIPVNKMGYFNFEEYLEPHVYKLKLNNEKFVTLVINNGQNIIITGDANGPSPLQIKGSEDTKKLEAYENFRKASLNRLVISVRNQVRELKDKGTSDNDPRLIELNKLEVENYELHKEELMAFVKNEMGTSLAIYPTSLRWGGENNIPFLIKLAKAFEAAHPNTEITRRVNEKVNALQANVIGGKVIDIKMPDINGEMVPLTSINAKYILIDFWASWCAPCRRESSLLGDLYRRFRSAGFEIYGVGLESSKDIWFKAIDKDKRTWINVSTFQGFETPATFDYAVTSLPVNILIDRSGKVIARNLHGNDLKTIVEKLFTTSLNAEMR